MTWVFIKILTYMSKLNVQIKIWVGEGAIIKIKHASMTLLKKKPNMKTMQLRNQQTCMISLKNLCMKSSWD